MTCNQSRDKKEIERAIYFIESALKSKECQEDTSTISRTAAAMAVLDALNWAAGNPSAFEVAVGDMETINSRGGDK